MILALLAMYFLGGGSGIAGSMLTTKVLDQFSEQTALVVTDPARVDAAQETLRALSNEVEMFEKVFARSGEQLTTAYENHASTADEALAILENLNSEWALSQQRAIALRFELKESLTESEWTALFMGE